MVGVEDTFEDCPTVDGPWECGGWFVVVAAADGDEICRTRKGQHAKHISVAKHYFVEVLQIFSIHYSAFVVV